MAGNLRLIHDTDDRSESNAMKTKEDARWVDAAFMREIG